MNELAIHDQPSNHIQVNGQGIFFDMDKFSHFERVAERLANSGMVPETFKGDVGSCLIALNMSARMGLDVLMLMQKIYIVPSTKKPAIEGQLAIALINSSGKFTPLLFKFVGTPGQMDYGCYAFATRKMDGVVVNGPMVTWQMVCDEKWNDDKKGKNKYGNEYHVKSKWSSMRDVMFQYRSGSFFGRVYCPEVLMGFSTVEEEEDINTAMKDITPRDKVAALPENIGSGMNIYETVKPKEPEPASPVKPRYETVIEAFVPYKVTVNDLCIRSGTNKELWNDAIYADFTSVIKELKKGASRDDFFPSTDDHAKACVRLDELSEENKHLVDRLLAGRNPDNMTENEIVDVVKAVEDSMK